MQLLHDENIQSIPSKRKLSEVEAGGIANDFDSSVHETLSGGWDTNGAALKPAGTDGMAYVDRSEERPPPSPARSVGSATSSKVKIPKTRLHSLFKWV